MSYSQILEKVNEFLFSSSKDNKSNYKKNNKKIFVEYFVTPYGTYTFCVSEGTLLVREVPELASEEIYKYYQQYHQSLVEIQKKICYCYNQRESTGTVPPLILLSWNDWISFLSKCLIEPIQDAVEKADERHLRDK